jgi:sugar-specific transcriptional regulator TrmB
VGQEREVHMEERVKDILDKIKRTAEIILEHQSSRPFKNNIITLGAESIITMIKEAIDEIEKIKKEE